jgi:predicted DsbA family dithiol-disulfide isomerase
MDSARFSITYDYRCPFARNAHEHVLAGLADGAPWEVTFLPFSLSQAHVPEGGTPVWDDPGKRQDLMAPAASVVVRERHPEHFAAVHLALFAARHDESRDLRLQEVVADVLSSTGLSADDVLAEVEAGWPLQTMRKEHESAVNDYQVFGVPTFVMGDTAVFVRIMTRPDDPAASRRLIDRVLGRISDEPEINEFKHTSLHR